jgi:hypothetical protein
MTKHPMLTQFSMEYFLLDFHVLKSGKRQLFLIVNFIESA